MLCILIYNTTNIIQTLFSMHDCPTYLEFSHFKEVVLYESLACSWTRNGDLINEVSLYQVSIIVYK